MDFFFQEKVFVAGPERQKRRKMEPAFIKGITSLAYPWWGTPTESCAIGLVLQPIGSEALNMIYFKCIAVELFNSKFSWCHRHWCGSKKNEQNYFIGKRFNF